MQEDWCVARPSASKDQLRAIVGICCGILNAIQDWCVAKPSASNDQLKAIISVCCTDVNCSAVVRGRSGARK